MYVGLPLLQFVLFFTGNVSYKIPHGFFPSINEPRDTVGSASIFPLFLIILFYFKFLLSLPRKSSLVDFFHQSRKIQLTCQDRGNRKRKNVGVLNKNRKRKNSPIVLEHYYTSKRLWRTSKRGKLKGGALQFDFVQSNREFKLHVYGG